MSIETTSDARRAVTMKVNGESAEVAVEVDETLLDTLRERLGYTAPRGTCHIGVCGTCTVLVDGKVVSSCLMLTAQAAEAEVTTAEGLGCVDGGLSEVQDAFVRKGAYQCSFCIPAMALSVHAALRDPLVEPDRDSVRDRLGGNLCRCGTYPEILEAVTDLMASQRTEPTTSEED